MQDRKFKINSIEGISEASGKFNSNDSFLIYCHHGSRSFYACAYMLQQGFKEVYNLDGGIDAWSQERLIIQSQNIKNL